MNKINFFLIILIAVGAVCGCKYSFSPGGETSRTEHNSRRADERATRTKTEGDKQSRRATANDSDDAAEDDAANSSADTTDDDSADTNDGQRRAIASGDYSRIVGKWSWSRTGSTTYTDGGAYAGGNGSRFTYQFYDDGAVQFVGIMNVMQGSCSQQITTIKNGQATLDGDRLTIDWSPADFTRDFSCDTANNYEKSLPASTETATVAFRQSSGQEQLCLIGTEETCFSPAE